MAQIARVFGAEVIYCSASGAAPQEGYCQVDFDTLLDVLAQEPISEDCPLRNVREKDRLLITPHVAWAAVESRQRLMQIVAGQIREFFATV